MNRQRNHDTLIDALESCGYSYEVLDRCIKTSLATHVRVKGLGDVWPTTGTAHINGEWIKRDAGAVIVRIGAVDKDTGEIKSTIETRLSQLEQAVSVIFGKIEQLTERRG